MKRTCFKDRHVPGCRPARPLCARMRKMRENRQACGCDAYHYPHRRGGGACGNPFHPFVSPTEWMETKREARARKVDPIELLRELGGKTP